MDGGWRGVHRVSSFALDLSVFKTVDSGILAPHDGRCHQAGDEPGGEDEVGKHCKGISSK